jgi:hypothetical protein
MSHGSAPAPNERLKLTGAAILVSELQGPCRRPRQLSLAFGGPMYAFNFHFP